MFIQVAKNVEVTRGKIWAVRRMLKCFPVKSLKLIPNQISSMGTGVIMQKDDSRSTAFLDVLTLWRVSAPSDIKKRTTPLCYSLLFISNADEHTLHYAHLQTNKETLCGPVRMQMAVSIRYDSVTNFFEECVSWRVFGLQFTAPHMYREHPM